MTKENKERIPVLLIKCSVSNCHCMQTVYRVHTANVGLLTDVLYQSNTNRMIFPRALSPGAQNKVLQFPINASTLQCFYPAYCLECLIASKSATNSGMCIYRVLNGMASSGQHIYNVPSVYLLCPSYIQPLNALYSWVVKGRFL